VVAAVIWLILCVSIVLTLRALLSHSWLLTRTAALASLFFSLIAISPLSLVTFLLTCLQLATAVALRRSTSPCEWISALAAALLVWVGVVPARLLGPVQADRFYVLPLAILPGSLLLIRPRHSEF
jgi:hypothetical protein